MTAWLTLLAWLVLLAATPSIARAADVDWTGSWETKWHGGGARLDLRQSGDHVTGHYPLYGGDIDARASGRQLKGRWMAGPRHGEFDFTMAPDGRSFSGRYDNGEWWTGGRVNGAADASPVDRADLRDTVRAFVRGGNLANAGHVEELGAAAAAIDVKNYPQPVLQNDRLRIAKELHDLVSLTTFQIWNIPAQTAKGDAFTLKLHQAGTEVVLALDLARRDGQWWIIVPAEDQLAAARKALLARSGGRPPGPLAYLKLRTARDTVVAFHSAVAAWDRDGRQRAIATLDTSRLYPATREFEAGFAVQYLKMVLDRVSSAVPQEIPDDPDDRQPYVMFSHPAGDIVIAPEGDGNETVWRFTPQTLSTIRTLYDAVEDMPLADPRAVEAPPPSVYFAERRWLRQWAPALMQRVGPVKLWQILGGVVGALVCLLVATLATAPFTALLSRNEGARSQQAERALRWPLRISLGALLLKLLIPYFGWPEEVRRYTAPIHALLIGIFGVWAAWFLIDLVAARMMERARKSARGIDDITISLVSVTLRLTMFFVAGTYMATELAIPTNGILAGLGISGLAVAFASKETLSNVFGAGVLVADRPFKKGDLISAGDIQGTVEQVGIRSTRIRTAEDTQVIVPNGKLSDSSINNWGLRAARLFQTRILVAYGTPTAKLDAFLSALRRHFTEHETVAADRTDIGLAALNDKTIAIEVTTYLQVTTISAERAIKSRLMLAALRLAEELGLVVGEAPETAAERLSEPAAKSVREMETADRD